MKLWTYKECYHLGEDMEEDTTTKAINIERISAITAASQDGYSVIHLRDAYTEDHNSQRTTFLVKGDVVNISLQINSLK